MKKNLQTDHDFSLTSGQIVSLIAGQVVIVLLAFVAGLLVGRYDMARELVTLARQSPEQAATAVPLARPTGPAARTQKPADRTTPPVAKRTATLPGKPPAAAPTAKPPVKPTPPAPKKPATTKPAPAPAKRPTKPAEPQNTQVAAAKKPQPASPAAKKLPAKPIPTPAPAKKQAVTANGTYSIQVFWSRGQQKTADYVKKLEQAGLDAWVKPPGAGQVGYRAMVGRYPTRSDATKVLKELRQKKEFADAWIPPLR